jgi:DNA-binding XRE family transcriptional regulator
MTACQLSGCFQCTLLLRRADDGFVQPPRWLLRSEFRKLPPRSLGRRYAAVIGHRTRVVIRHGASCIRWTQLDVAFKLGMTPLTMSNRERGKFQPSASRLHQIAHLEEMSRDDIAFVAGQGKAAA